MKNMEESGWQKIKALSLKQPFADLIVIGKKTIELRSWNTKVRGDFLVHASLTPIKSQYVKFGYKLDELPRGCIVGKATIIDVKHYDITEQWEADAHKHYAGLEFAASDYGYILTNAVKFEKPIPVAGQLNFFDLYFNSELNQVRRVN